MRDRIDLRGWLGRREASAHQETRMAALLPFPLRPHPRRAGGVVLAGRSLLKVATMADLMRIRGIGVQWAELLEATGIGVAELRLEEPETITERMARVNTARKIARRVPSVALVRRWAEAARGLGEKTRT
jgi:hypothetical protein